MKLETGLAVQGPNNTKAPAAAAKAAAANESDFHRHQETAKTTF